MEAGGDAVADQGAEAVKDVEAARAALMRANAPENSAAELRELAELSDLLAELAGLVHDLGTLIIGLMTAATGAGDRQVRTFTIPPGLAELATAHQELKAEQRALSARFEAAGGHQERVALRGSLAALTERATRAVAAAAAATAVTPQENPAAEGADGPGSDEAPDTAQDRMQHGMGQIIGRDALAGGARITVERGDWSADIARGDAPPYPWRACPGEGRGWIGQAAAGTGRRRA